MLLIHYFSYNKCVTAFLQLAEMSAVFSKAKVIVVTLYSAKVIVMPRRII